MSGRGPPAGTRVRDTCGVEVALAVLPPACSGPDDPAGRNLFDLGGLLMGLSELLGSEVDLVESGCIHPYIRDRVLA